MELRCEVGYAACPPDKSLGFLGEWPGYGGIELE
jgi:hypothetical protein